MNCTTVNAIVDEHRDARLTAAERNAVDAHLLGCADCAAGWLAHMELCAIEVPEMAPTLLTSVIAASSHGTRRVHGSRRGGVITTALLAGAALAAISVTQLRELTHDDASALAPAQLRVPPTSEPVVASDSSARTTPSAGALPVDTTLVEVYVAPVVRTAPDYPVAAQERGLEGSVTLQYDVTATGAVENVSIVQSTDPSFDEAAATALAQWKYLPRIAAGKRVASLAQQTTIRFQLDRAPVPPARQAALARENASRELNARGLSIAMEGAWQRVTTDDLRGAELQLDEARALYALDGFQEGNVWDFYAYLYTVEGNYDRAIEAYETGIASYARGSRPSQGSWLPLANLYYARHQYDLALRTLLRYKEGIKGTPAESRRNPMADAFIARLAALGVTEATLNPRR